MATNLPDPTELRGASVTGRGGVPLGRVDDVYLDKENGRALWAAVETGAGGHVVLVPLAAADHRDGALRLPYTSAQVRDAPLHDPHVQISADDERRLLDHYDVPYPDGAGDTMTRSEEELHVGTRTVATGRVRVRKRVVTEMATVTVPVSHEELTIEREDLDEDDGEAPAGSGLSSTEHEIILYAERPVVTTRVVATERVRIGTRTVHEEQEVSGQVRKEKIDLEQPGPVDRP